jgi:hypothetical protein
MRTDPLHVFKTSPALSAAALHVVTCVANPMRWESRIRLAKRFIEHMLDAGVDVTVVETAYGERPFELAEIPHIRHVPTRAATMAWSKESSLNVGIRALPASAKYICWPDADITFASRTWPTDILHGLQLMPVLQPWSEALDLGPNGEVMTIKGQEIQRSFGWVWRAHGNVTDWWQKKQAGEPYAYPHSGYCWSATMDWFNAVGGLLDFSGLGAGDHQMSMSMVGQIEKAIHGLSSPGYVARVKAWGDRCYGVTKGHVGYVQGRIEHSFHGAKANRLYVERWDILNKYAFDPNTDLILNRWGILELAGNKPEMERAFQAYFKQRDEDSYYSVV